MTETRPITEFVRPRGDKRTFNANMSSRAAAVFDAVVAAGFTYALERIGTVYTLYISDDELEHDFVTTFVSNNEQFEERIMQYGAAKMIEMREAYEEALAPYRGEDDDMGDDDEAPF